MVKGKYVMGKLSLSAQALSFDGANVLFDQVDTEHNFSVEDVLDHQKVEEQKVQEKIVRAKRDYSSNEVNISILSKFNNKSEAIRHLLKEGKSRSEVADLLNIRYQHVRNVELQILKKKG